MTQLNKTDAVEKQLEAAFFLLLNDFAPEATHTLIAAARGILYGLASHDGNVVLEKWDSSVLARVVGPNKKEIRDYQNKVANFLKHSDRDQNNTLDFQDMNGLNEIELQICIVALGLVKKTISTRLNWAIWYLSLSPNALIPFETIAQEFNHTNISFADFRNADREITNEALLKIYLTDNPKSEP